MNIILLELYLRLVDSFWSLQKESHTITTTTTTTTTATTTTTIIIINNNCSFSSKYYWNALFDTIQHFDHDIHSF